MSYIKEEIDLSKIMLKELLDVVAKHQKTNKDNEIFCISTSHALVMLVVNIIVRFVDDKGGTPNEAEIIEYLHTFAEDVKYHYKRYITKPGVLN